MNFPSQSNATKNDPCRFPSGAERNKAKPFVLAIAGVALLCGVAAASPPMDEQERAAAIRKAFENVKTPSPRWPSLGMSAAQAARSSWGKPSSIHRTEDASGTHEQWVYGNSGYYLYF